MFDGSTTQQYHRDVILGIELFLDALPDMKEVLEAIPNRDWLIDSFRETQPTAFDSAAYISMICSRTS